MINLYHPILSTTDTWTKFGRRVSGNPNGRNLGNYQFSMTDF